MFSDTARYSFQEKSGYCWTIKEDSGNALGDSSSEQSSEEEEQQHGAFACVLCRDLAW
jgi:hypothetical protein